MKVNVSTLNSMILELHAKLPSKNWREYVQSTISHEELEDMVRLDGFLSKFEEPSDERIAELTEVQFAKFLEANDNLVDPFTRAFDEFDTAILDKARVHMDGFQKHLKYDLNDLFYGPGTNLSMKKGRIGYADKALSHITVYPHQLGIAVAILREVRAYRRYVRSQYCILPGTSKEDQLAILDEAIRSQLIVVGGARGDTVYKNREKRRFIAVEASFATMLQRVIGRAFRRAIKSYFNIDLDVQADVHKDLVCHLSSVDEKDASNCIHRNDPSFLGLKGKHCSLIHLAAPEATLVNSKGRKWYVNNNLCSTMGCGFTFELLTLINLCYARAFDPASQVFGDDVLISPKYFDDYVAFVQRATNFVVNEAKSFNHTNSRVTESCGYYSVDKVLVRSYSVKWVSDLSEAIPTVNKIAWLARTLRDPGLRKLCKDVHRKLIAYLSTCGWTSGPFCGFDNLPEYLEGDYACSPKLRRHKRILERLQYKPEEVAVASVVRTQTLGRSIASCKARDQRLLFVFLKTQACPIFFSRREEKRFREELVLFHQLDGRLLT